MTSQYKMHILKYIGDDLFPIEAYCGPKSDIVDAQSMCDLLADNNYLRDHWLYTFTLCTKCLDTYPNKKEVGMLLLKVLE